jgi:RNA polymerase sigma factor (sigma-70 family)
MHAACVVGAQEAEDVVQTALLRAWRGMDTFKGQANPLTWLTTIVIRTACDKRRTQKRQEWQVSDDALWVVDHSPTPDRAVQARHDLNVVMETIPASQRYLVTHEPRQSTTLTRQERETKKLLRKKVSSQFESSKFI